MVAVAADLLRTDSGLVPVDVSSESWRESWNWNCTLEVEAREGRFELRGRVGDVDIDVFIAVDGCVVAGTSFAAGIGVVVVFSWLWCWERRLGGRETRGMFVVDVDVDTAMATFVPSFPS